MNTCETHRNAMTDALVDGRELSEELEGHLRECDGCLEEYALSQRIWGMIPEFEPSDRSSEASLLEVSWWQRNRQALAAAVVGAVLFGAGITIGKVSSDSHREPDVAVLEEKVDSLNELVALSLLEQSSASARLEAISRIAAMEDPSPGTVTGLIRSAVTDPNPNVRLAAVEAARPLVERPGVYEELAERLTIESSALVQIALVDLLMEDPDAGAAEIARLLEREDVEDEVRAFVKQRAGVSI